MQQFIAAQAAGVSGPKQRAFATGCGGVEELQDLLGAEDRGERVRHLAVGNEVAQLRLAEGLTIEEAERADGLIVEAPGDIFPEEAELVSAGVFGAELGRGAAEMAGGGPPPRAKGSRGLGGKKY